MLGKVKVKNKLKTNLVKRLYKILKQLKWIRINVSKKVLERNFMLDLGILVYGFIKGRLESIIYSLPYFLGFLIICLICVFLFAIIERVILGLYKNK